MKSLSLTAEPAAGAASAVKTASGAKKAEPKFGLKDIEDESDHEHEQAEQTRRAQLAKVSVHPPLVPSFIAQFLPYRPNQ